MKYIALGPLQMLFSQIEIKDMCGIIYQSNVI